MSRSVAISFALLFAAACGPAPVPLTDVVVYWEFDRNTFIDGVVGIVPYDVNVNWPPGTGNRACPQAGVDVVDVADLNGNLLASAVPCVNQSVQGVVVPGFPGSNTYVVTGWRLGRTLPLYRGQVTVAVASGVPACGTFDCGTAIAAGIPDVLTVDAILVDASAPLGYRFCGPAGIQRFDAWLEDGFGTVVWRAAGSSGVPCLPSDVPGVSFGPVDRDVLTLWMDAIDERGTVPAIIWSRCGFGFPHFAGAESRFSLDLPLEVCNTPPPPP